VRIGIVGTGEIGGTLAALFVGAGHEVALSNSRGPDSLRADVDRLGTNARATTVAEAASFGEVVVLAIPFGRYRELPVASFAGRVVVDTTNYFAERDGELDVRNTGHTTSSEVLAAFLAASRVVKAFNTMNFALLRDEGKPPDALARLAVPFAGDEPDALALLADLIDEIGFDPFATGSLADGGRGQQPGSPLFNRPLTSDEARTALDGFRKGQ
jgi:predicted dinucleotide-binding enzyme